MLVETNRHIDDCKNKLIKPLASLSEQLIKKPVDISIHCSMSNQQCFNQKFVKNVENHKGFPEILAFSIKVNILKVIYQSYLCLFVQHEKYFSKTQMIRQKK